MVYAQPSPYVVNQGPVYSGPGLMIPYQTYSPENAYMPATGYPYVPGYGYGGYGYGGYGYGGYGYGGAAVSPPYYAYPHYRYRARVAVRPYYAPGPRYYRPAPHWRHYP